MSALRSIRLAAVALALAFAIPGARADGIFNPGSSGSSVCGTSGQVQYNNAGSCGGFSLGTNVQTALGLTLNGSGALAATTNPAFVTPALGVATGTSLALGGATPGTNAFAVNGTTLLNGNVTIGSSSVTELFNVVSTSGAVFLSAYGGSPLQLSLANNASFGFNPNSSVTGANDTNLYRDAAGILAQRYGANAQIHRVYYSYTDASDGAWASMDAGVTTAGVVTFGTNGNGTGASTLGKLQFNVLGVNKLDYGVTTAGTWTTGGTFAAAAYIAGGSAGVSCAANSVTLLTEVVTNGIVTHC
jgi:hypothetical protein